MKPFCGDDIVINGRLDESSDEKKSMVESGLMNKFSGAGASAVLPAACATL
jgi:hypothetical protein